MAIPELASMIKGLDLIEPPMRMFLIVYLSPKLKFPVTEDPDLDEEPLLLNININHSNRLDKCELAAAETILLLDPFIAAPPCLAVYLHSSYICTTAPDAKYGYLCQMSVYMCANII